MRTELNDKVNDALSSLGTASLDELARETGMSDSRAKRTLTQHVAWMVKNGDLNEGYELGSAVYSR